MNAVERLLAHGEQLLLLFDEMYRERIGPRREKNLPDVPEELIYAAGHMATYAMPTGGYWSSIHWLRAATEAAWLELRKPKVKPTKEEVAARAADLFRDYLAKREQLLSDATWRRLLADVVFESRGWDPLAEKVVSLAEQVAAEVRQVEQVPGNIEPQEWRSERLLLRFGAPAVPKPAKRTSLRESLDRLHPYAQPPKPTAPAATEKEQTGGRKRVGRKQNNESLARELLDGWRAYETEDGRRLKRSYIAQRADVRVIKSREARERKIESLLLALNSAQHLKREKAKAAAPRRN